MQSCGALSGRITCLAAVAAVLGLAGATPELAPSISARDGNVHVSLLQGTSFSVDCPGDEMGDRGVLCSGGDVQEQGGGCVPTEEFASCPAALIAAEAAKETAEGATSTCEGELESCRGLLDSAPGPWWVLHTQTSLAMHSNPADRGLTIGGFNFGPFWSSIFKDMVTVTFADPDHPSATFTATADVQDLSSSLQTNDYAIVLNQNIPMFTEEHSFELTVAISGVAPAVPVPFKGAAGRNRLYIRASWSGAEIDANNRIVLLGGGFAPVGVVYICSFTDHSGGSTGLLTTPKTQLGAYVSESRIDCGGAPAFAVGTNSLVIRASLLMAPTASLDGSQTEVVFDGVEVDRQVAVNTCENGAREGSETDVDCGGLCATACAAGKTCAVDEDCADGNECRSTVCEAIYFTSCATAIAAHPEVCSTGVTTSTSSTVCSNWQLHMIVMGGVTVPTYCQQADGKVWTLVGKVSGGDTDWTYGEQSNENHDSPWEDGSTFGTPTGTESYKNALWDHLAASEMLITEGGVVGGVQQPNAAPVLRTNDNCIGGQTLDAFFSTKSWTCGGSVSFDDTLANGADDCTNACKNVESFATHQDGVLNRGRVSRRMYFHAGEKNGAQETNEDRAMISGGMRSNVDYPSGLGSYCTGGCATSGGRAISNPSGTDGHSNNIGKGAEDGSHPADTSLVYSIWLTE